MALHTQYPFPSSGAQAHETFKLTHLNSRGVFLPLSQNKENTAVLGFQSWQVDTYMKHCSSAPTDTSDLQTRKDWSDELLNYPYLQPICSSHSLLIQVTGLAQNSLHTPEPSWNNVHVKIISHLLKSCSGEYLSCSKIKHVISAHNTAKTECHHGIEHRA